MIAIDTNILVYAHRTDSLFHKAADRCVSELIESGKPWAVPFPCLHEFLCITTHPRVFSPPTPIDIILEHVEGWMESPTLQLIGETLDHWAFLKALLVAGKIAGPRVHDARIAAICKAHHVSTLWSADRDFSRISGVKVVNPLLR